jgi:hypothetical protein
LAALVSVSFSAAAADEVPNFSAFAHEGILYVTFLGDSCNAVGGDLRVAGICRSDRLTRNYAVECDATLAIMQTEMACGDTTAKPRTVEINLEQAKVAPEARVLHLKHYDQTIDVKLK